MGTGSFDGGVLIDEWRHFDDEGRLIGRSRPESPVSFRGAGYLLHVLSPGEPAYWVHQAEVAGTRHRLDFIADGREHLYVRDGEDVAYDSTGHKVAMRDGLWESSDCHWNKLERATARVGDVVTLHGLLFREPRVCDGAEAVPAARGARIEAMLSSVHGGRGDASRAGVPEAVASSLASFVDEPSALRAPVAAHSPAPLAQPPTTSAYLTSR